MTWERDCGHTAGGVALGGSPPGAMRRDSLGGSRVLIGNLFGCYGDISTLGPLNETLAIEAGWNRAH